MMGVGIVQIVREMRSRLINLGGGNDPFNLVPVSRPVHLLPGTNEVVEQADETQQAKAGSNLRPEQLVNIEHLNFLSLSRTWPRLPD
jgi:hypothetical protein